MTHYTQAHWGIYEIEANGSATPSILPWRRDPDPSAIGLHALAPELDRVRVRRPSVRRSWLERGPGSAPELRGREPFVEVEWDVALDLVAAELTRVRAEHGNDAIFGGSYGWASAGRFHHANSQVHRFLNMIGGYVRHNDSYSLGAGRVIMPHIVMPIDAAWNSHTSWDVIVEHTKLFVTFGGVPAKNAQSSSGGAADHRVREGLYAMGRSGMRVVNISPVRDNIDTGAEVEWIPIRPNTDTALMMALAHTLVTDGSVDRDFLARCCNGYEKFEPYLMGAVDGVAKTADWASAITGVPAARITALAREMAANRTMLNTAWSLQRASHGEQPFWMIVTLASMLGQVGLPGGGFAVGYGPTNGVGSSHINLPGPSLPQGTNKVRGFIPVARIADMLLNPGTAFHYNGGVHTYPDIKLVYWAGGNPFHHHQDLNRLQRAFRRPETVIVNEPWWTATARHADIVLPATTTLERDDVGASSRDRYILAMQQAIPPVGEARDDFDIFSDLAERLGTKDAFTEGRGKREWIRFLYDRARRGALEQNLPMPDFDTFWEQGFAEILAPADDFILFQDFRSDPVAHPLRTLSGRIELYSEAIAAFGYDDCPGHPAWLEPAEWLGSPQVADHPLHLVSNQPRTRLHSQLEMSPVSVADKVGGREALLVNPLDAAKRGISSGDVVRVFNGRGACLTGATVTDAVRPGVVQLAAGAWFDPLDGGTDNRGNPNVLTYDRGTSRLGQGCAALTTLVEIERFAGEAPAVGTIVPPEILKR